MEEIELFKHNYTKILIVDDNEAIRDSLEYLCEKRIDEDLSFVHAACLEEAYKQIKENFFNVILLDKDLDLPNGKRENGIESIPEFLDLSPLSEIVVVTASENPDDIVQAMKLGAGNYIVKASDQGLQSEKIKQAINLSKMKQRKHRTEKYELKRKKIFFPGTSTATVKLKNQLQAIAYSSAKFNVLLEGETGVEKEQAAKYIHHLREKQAEREIPFYPVNLASFNENDIDVELFGIQKGPQNNLRKSRPGFFELADGGIIFLNNISEASLSVQAKLLTVLESKQFYRVGSKELRSSDFLLLCASDRNLEEMVQKKEFNKELYSKISIFKIEIPNLKQRKSDIPEIIEYLLPDICDAMNFYMQYEDLPSSLINYFKSSEREGNVQGIINELSTLFLRCPKDKNNRPVLNKWKSILKAPSMNALEKMENSYSFQDILNVGIDCLNPKFSELGLNEFIDQLEKKILFEVFMAFGSGKETARWLKLRDANVSYRIRKHDLLKTIKDRKRPKISVENLLENINRGVIQ